MTSLDVQLQHYHGNRHIGPVCTCCIDTCTSDWQTLTFGNQSFLILSIYFLFSYHCTSSGSICILYIPLYLSSLLPPPSPSALPPCQVKLHLWRLMASSLLPSPPCSACWMGRRNSTRRRSMHSGYSWRRKWQREWQQGRRTKRRKVSDDTSMNDDQSSRCLVYLDISPYLPSLSKRDLTTSLFGRYCRPSLALPAVLPASTEQYQCSSLHQVYIYTCMS